MSKVGDDRRTRLSRSLLYLILTPHALPADWPLRLLAALDSSRVGAVQLRMPAADAEALRRTARRVKEVCELSRVLFVLNDHVELAVQVGADGAHVGQSDLSPARARKVLGPDRLLGLSTHGPEELIRARTLEVDYAGLGPCFETNSKVLSHAPGGAHRLQGALPAAKDLPVFAIGGITPQNAPLLVEAGATRLAVGAGVLGADDPAAAARFLHTLLERAQSATSQGSS